MKFAKKLYLRRDATGPWSEYWDGTEEHGGLGAFNVFLRKKDRKAVTRGRNEHGDDFICAGEQAFELCPNGVKELFVCDDVERNYILHLSSERMANAYKARFCEAENDWERNPGRFVEVLVDGGYAGEDYWDDVTVSVEHEDYGTPKWAERVPEGQEFWIMLEVGA